ncbi:MerR family DNA-binding protein [Micromonospora saelicesensis]|uniref:MerR family DNA-binding protein n=1 Tax=Micromonospora saelicesensis TaxID=285676 RepID=UPI003CE81B38
MTRRPHGRVATRDYDDGTVARLDLIRRGRAAGFTLAQIRDILAVRPTGPTRADMYANCSPNGSTPSAPAGRPARPTLHRGSASPVRHRRRTGHCPPSRSADT